MSQQGNLVDLSVELEAFAEERNWHQFHSPKNLAMALTVEAGELLEHFQWMTEADSRELSEEKLEAVREEIADVLLYLIRLADQFDIDLISAAEDKLKTNAAKYPAAIVKGSAKKYNEY